VTMWRRAQGTPPDSRRLVGSLLASEPPIGALVIAPRDHRSGLLSSASAGIASPTMADAATSACFWRVAPITSERPFISMPSSPSIWERSTRCGGTGEPLLHDRQQRVAAGDHLGVFILDQQIGGLPHGRRTMILESYMRYS